MRTPLNSRNYKDPLPVKPHSFFIHQIPMLLFPNEATRFFLQNRNFKGPPANQAPACADEARTRIVAARVGRAGATPEASRRRAGASAAEGVRVCYGRRYGKRNITLASKAYNSRTQHRIGFHVWRAVAVHSLSSAADGARGERPQLPEAHSRCMPQGSIHSSTISFYTRRITLNFVYSRRVTLAACPFPHVPLADVRSPSPSCLRCRRDPEWSICPPRPVPLESRVETAEGSPSETNRKQLPTSSMVQAGVAHPHTREAHGICLGGGIPGGLPPYLRISPPMKKVGIESKHQSTGSRCILADVGCTGGKDNSMRG